MTCPSDRPTRSATANPRQRVAAGDASYRAVMLPRTSRAWRLGYKYKIVRPDGSLAFLSPLTRAGARQEARDLEARERQLSLALRGRSRRKGAR